MTDAPEPTHLSERARIIAKSASIDRISYIFNWMWVSNNTAEEVEAISRRMLATENTSQAPCLLVVGPTGIGKTALLNHLKKHVFSKNRAIKYFDPRHCPTYKAFLTQLAKLLGISIASRNLPANSVLEDEIGRVFLLQGVKAIVIDNLHDLMRGTARDQRNILTYLRELSCAEKPILLLCFGIERVTSAIRSDEQLERRFVFFDMPVWRVGSEFTSFLSAIESELPLLNPSGLTGRSKVNFLISHSHGVTSKIIEAVKHAAIYAITTQQERITLELLKKGANAPFQQEGW
ncbi:TniB family NTP-binding protein [Pseudomonas putida]|uniref:TniB family NTP-binding protein n=1 Tax=Pseudomonas putida TaxID=303 RepID=UPI003D96E724